MIHGLGADGPSPRHEYGGHYDSSHHGEHVTPQDVMRPSGDSTYIDWGKLYGTYVLGHAMNWSGSPPTIDPSKIDSFLNQIFSELKASGSDTMLLSFGQISDIDQMLNEEKGSPSDTITQMFYPDPNDPSLKYYPVGSAGGPDFLQYFVQQAHKQGIKVDLSMGGSIATPANMKINGNPATEANNLVEFMQQNGLDGLGFDIEGGGPNALMTQNSPSDVNTFFETLHKQLSAASMPVILTVEGGLQQGPAGTLKILFDNFSDKFDGVNLMLYSNSQYYLDASNPTWGISQWMQYVPPGEIHIGFYDSIDYTNPSSSAGEKYDIPSGLSNGQAAAWLFLNLEADLAKLEGHPVDLGKPFIWTDDPTTIASNTFFTDFWNYLQTGPAPGPKPHPFTPHAPTSIQDLENELKAWAAQDPNASQFANRILQTLERLAGKNISLTGLDAWIYSIVTGMSANQSIPKMFDSLSTSEKAAFETLSGYDQFQTNLQNHSFTTAQIEEIAGLYANGIYGSSAADKNAMEILYQGLQKGETVEQAAQAALAAGGLSAQMKALIEGMSGYTPSPFPHNPTSIQDLENQLKAWAAQDPSIKNLADRILQTVERLAGKNISLTGIDAWIYSIVTGMSGNQTLPKMIDSLSASEKAAFETLSGYDQFQTNLQNHSFTTAQVEEVAGLYANGTYGCNPPDRKAMEALYQGLKSGETVEQAAKDALAVGGLSSQMIALIDGMTGYTS